MELDEPMCPREILDHYEEAKEGRRKAEATRDYWATKVEDWKAREKRWMGIYKRECK